MVKCLVNMSDFDNTNPSYSAKAMRSRSLSILYLLLRYRRNFVHVLCYKWPVRKLLHLLRWYFSVKVIQLLFFTEEFCLNYGAVMLQLDPRRNKDLTHILASTESITQFGNVDQLHFWGCSFVHLWTKLNRCQKGDISPLTMAHPLPISNGPILKNSEQLVELVSFWVHNST